MTEQNEIINYIMERTSAGGSVTAKEIASVFSTEEPQVRQAVAIARSNGVPIIAAHCGYRYSENTEDVWGAVRSLRSRILSQERAIAGLEKYLRNTQRPNSAEI